VFVALSEICFFSALCAFCESVGASLLVIGHRSDTCCFGFVSAVELKSFVFSCSDKFSIDHLLLGSNAVYAAKNAKCSVLVAK
jgi:nucleotide-binding universal stress UspA family protein